MLVLVPVLSLKIFKQDKGILFPWGFQVSLQRPARGRTDFCTLHNFGFSCFWFTTKSFIVKVELELHWGPPSLRRNEMCLCQTHSQHLNLFTAANEETVFGGQVNGWMVSYKFCEWSTSQWFLEDCSQCFIVVQHTECCKVPGKLHLCIQLVKQPCK